MLCRIALDSSYRRGVTEPVHQQVPAKVLETSTGIILYTLVLSSCCTIHAKCASLTAHIAYAKAEKNLNENLMGMHNTHIHAHTVYRLIIPYSRF